MTGSLLPQPTCLFFRQEMSPSCISVSAVLECIHFPIAFRPQVLLVTQYCCSSYIFSCVNKTALSWFLNLLAQALVILGKSLDGWLLLPEPRWPIYQKADANTLKQDSDNSCSDPLTRCLPSIASPLQARPPTASLFLADLLSFATISLKFTISSSPVTQLFKGMISSKGCTEYVSFSLQN